MHGCGVGPRVTVLHHEVKHQPLMFKCAFSLHTDILFKPNKPNELIHINWMGPQSFQGALGVFINFCSRFAASHLGQFCLPVSHRKDALK